MRPSIRKIYGVFLLLQSNTVPTTDPGPLKVKNAAIEVEDRRENRFQNQSAGN
jgi:hypothetical protein